MISFNLFFLRYFVGLQYVRPMSTAGSSVGVLQTTEVEIIQSPHIHRRGILAEHGQIKSFAVIFLFCQFSKK